MIKMKIGKKLLLTYFILLFVTFMVTGITFRISLQSYLVNETRIALKDEAKAMVKTLGRLPIASESTKPNILLRREIRILGQFIDSKAILISEDRKIIYSNLDEREKQLLQPFINGSNLKSREYVIEKAVIRSDKNDIKGYIFLFARIKDINQISGLMNKTLLVSLIVGAVFAVIIGMIFQLKLTKPIRRLQQYISNFSLKDNQQELKINTGDEIEELADCFAAMVKRLKSYDVRQKRFLQNTSHELKTPLMSIQGYAEAIKDGVVQGNELEESLGVIIEESRRLKRIVDEMIYLIKLDNVEETFKFERVSLQEIINQAVKSVKALLDAKELSLKIEGACSSEGYFDKDKLARAVINILSNAVRYAEKEITIKCIVHEKYIEAVIADDGRGFPEGEESKLFERFYKGDKGGTGIGLAIVKAIILGHGGQVVAYNCVPKGAAFKITLPKLPGSSVLP